MILEWVPLTLIRQVPRSEKKRASLTQQEFLEECTRESSTADSARISLRNLQNMQVFRYGMV